MGKVFRFTTALRVTLVNGETVRITREVVVEDTDEVQAHRGVHSVAAELCHDAGSDWFDAPVVEVEVVEVKLTDVG